jgi:hypothetical protein
MIYPLAWKEYREQRTVWLILAAACLLATYAVAQIFGPIFVADLNRDVFVSLVVLVLSTTGVYGVVCGALLLAGEDEAGMRPFLHRHAGWRFRLWVGKFLVGAAFSVAFGLALSGGWALLQLPPPGKESTLWFLALPAVALEALVWGFVGGALMRTTMAAAIVAAVMLLVVWLCTVMAFGEAGLFLVGRLLMLALGVVASAATYCNIDLRRVLAGGRAARLLKANRAPGGWLSLCWLTYRQTRWLMLFLVVLGVAVGVALPWVGVVGWALCSLVFGITFGVGVFAGDQPTGRLFLGERRVPPHRVWLTKTVFAAVFLTTLTGLIALLAISHSELMRMTRASTMPQPDGPAFPFRMLYHDVGPVGLAAYWLVYGFSIGQLLAFLFRKGLVALVLALLLGGLVPLVWIPSMLGGGVHLWQLFLPLAPLLLATLLTMRAWLSDRLATRGPVFAVVGGVALAVLLTAAGIGYRVMEIPDIGEPFDVDAYRRELSRGRTGKLEDAIKLAIREYKSRKQEVEGGLPPAGGAPAGQVVLDERAAVQEQLSQLDQGGATRIGKELGHYLDAMFGAPWPDTLHSALRLPPEMLENPNTIGTGSHLESWTLREMAALLRARAMQIQKRGEVAGALQHLRTVLQVSRALKYRATLEGFGGGLWVEHGGLDGIATWLRGEKPPAPEQLRSLAGILAEEERLRPDLEETLKIEEVVERNLLREPTYVARLFDPLDQANQHNKADEALTLLAEQVPWEGERLRRKVNLFSQRLAGALESAFPISRSPRLLQEKTPADMRAAILEEMTLNGPRMQVFMAQRLSFDEKAKLCRARALRIETALVLYQVEQGKVSPALEALVPRYLEALPKDPYSGKGFRYRVSDGEWIEDETGPALGVSVEMGWHAWFTKAAAEPGVPVVVEPGDAPPPGGGGVGQELPAGVGSTLLYAEFEAMNKGSECGTAVGMAGFVGLWVGPPGQNFLTPAWLVPGLDLGLNRFQPVRPGQGVLWSVGPDGIDDGGRVIVPVVPMQTNRGIDLVFIVPDFIRGGNP